MTTVATQIVDMPSMNFLAMAGSGEEDHLMMHAEDAAEFLKEAAAEEEEIKSGSTL